MENGQEQPQGSVATAMKAAEDTIGQELAIKAVGIVKPMLNDCCNGLSEYCGDNERVILIRKTNNKSVLSILVLDTKKDFTIKGAAAKQYSADGVEVNQGVFVFTGSSLPGESKPEALEKFFIAEEFIDLLLSGKMKEITEKLKM